MAARALHSGSYRPLCRLLRKWRMDAGLSQKELADRLRRVPSWVHKSEAAERRVDPSEMIAWCRATGVEPTRAITQLEDAIGKPRLVTSKMKAIVKRSKP